MCNIVVSLCVREWIETRKTYQAQDLQHVSLCVREWIETPMCSRHLQAITVSLCVREWIETWKTKKNSEQR